PTSKRPLIDPKQLRCLHLVELRRLVAAQNVKKPHHTHTLKGFRPAHQTPRKGADATGQIVCYVIRTYRVLATFARRSVCAGRTRVYKSRRRKGRIQPPVMAGLVRAIHAVLLNAVLDPPSWRVRTPVTGFRPWASWSD